MKRNHTLAFVLNCLLGCNVNEKVILQKNCKALFFLFLVALLPYYTTAQVSYSPDQKWEWIHPKPQGSFLRWCKMWDSDNWYIAGNAGTFMKTTNGGQSWYITYNAGRIDDDRARGDVWDVHFFNQNTGILVGTRHTVSKTTDGGITFDSIPGLYSTESWFSINFLNNYTGYITGLGRLAKTTDSGNTWQYINSIDPTVNHYKLYTPNDTLLIVCSPGGNIQRSTNGGTSWTTISTGTSSQLLRIKFLNQDTGFVCGTNGVVRLTTDKGLTWYNVNNGIPVNTYYDIDFKTLGPVNTVFLTGNAQYIYKTTNLGQSWDTVGIWGANQTNFGLYQGYTSTELGGGDTILTVGTYSLINKRNSASNRILFSDFVKFGNASIYDIWVEKNNIWGVGLASQSGIRYDQVIYSSNSGANWIVQDVGNSTAVFNSIYMLDNNTGYIVGGDIINSGFRGRIRKTVNGGTSWDSLVSPSAKRLTRIEFVNPYTGWMFGETSTIYKTTNGAANWVQQPAPTLSVLYTSSSMINESTGWIVGYVENTLPTTSIVNKTTDGGLNWLTQDPNIPLGRGVLCIDMLDENNGYFGGYLNVRKTTNGGINWDSVALPFPEYQICGLDFINPQTGMLLDTYGSTSLKTTNGGASWIVDYLGTIAGYDASYFTSFIKMKMVSESTAYTGSSFAGILKYSSSSIGIIEWQSGAPNKYELYQNYPNPFNPSTTIKFSIPKAGNVTLKVYDITGREVREVLNNIQLNAGTITHNFDGFELASGIYFYSLLIDGNLIDTKKMVLVK